jgi:hypothetical protein
MRRILTCSLLLASLLTVALVGQQLARAAAADDKPKAPAAGAAGAASDPMAGMDAKAKENMMKAMMPGPEHELLKQMAGKWTCDVKFKMAPDQPENTSSGTSVDEMVLGGRFLKSDFSGEFMGQPFHGMGLTGYDTVKKQYVATWMDETSTGMMMMTGSADAAGKVMTMTGSAYDPMVGKDKNIKQITRILSPDQHVSEFYDVGPDGKEFKSMTLTYTRQK